MYFYEDMVAKAVKKSGLRAVLAEGIIETEREEHFKGMLKRSVNFIQKFHKSRNGRINCLFGPHAVYSCSSELLSEISELATKLGVGIHVHLAESKLNSSKLEDAYGGSEVEFLDKIGLLKHHVLAAHCVNLSVRDMKILSDRRVNVAYVPVANMKLGLGAARINELIDLGVNVGLGTDGPASNNSLDMFETMKVAALLQKNAYSDPTVLPAEEVVKMATNYGAKALGLENQIGSIETGKKADLILLDVSKPHLKPLHNIYATIVYSARGSDVDTTIVDGKIVMENRMMKTLNEQIVITQAEKTAFNLISVNRLPINVSAVE
jgi:5-methylthioadenosine/S-adenosylhomocysteine deaminase